MGAQSILFHIMKKQYFQVSLSLLLLTLFLSGCSVLSWTTNQHRSFYEGVIVKKDGTTQKAYVLMPQAEDKQISVSHVSSGADAVRMASEEVAYIQLHNSQSPQREQRFYYLPKQRGGKAWMAYLNRGDALTAYILAVTYVIEKDGSLSLVGIQQRTTHGNGTSMVVNPSYHLYLQKNGLPPKFVSLIGGINFEASSFRHGVVRYLSDDDELCQYIQGLKWSFDDLDQILHYYNPNRSGSLAIKDDHGNLISLPPRSLITHALNDELTYTLSVQKPMAQHFGMGIGLGLRSSWKTYFTYGAEVGYNQPRYVSQESIIEQDFINYSKVDISQYEVRDEFIKRDHVFNFNAFAGVQAPFNFKKLYLVPSINMTLGGDFGSEFAAISAGPMARLDFGIPLKYGSVFFVGLGYRYAHFLKSEDDRINTTYKNINTYAPLGSFYFTIAYTL